MEGERRSGMGVCAGTDVGVDVVVVGIEVTASGNGVGCGWFCRGLDRVRGDAET